MNHSSSCSAVSLDKETPTASHEVITATFTHQLQFKADSDTNAQTLESQQKHT